MNLRRWSEQSRVDFESPSSKGVKVHSSAKHKSKQVPIKPPMKCIREEDGCTNSVEIYFNKYTAICSTCSLYLKEKMKMSPFHPSVCPCCHLPNQGQPFSFCQECLDSIYVDGYAESGWGSWHLDGSSGQIVCIHLDFD